ncbi:MAG: ABC transporter permease [Streptosporangiaceae bacterium]
MNHAYVLRIARLDLSLLWRNRISLFGVLGLPVFFGTILFVSPEEGSVSSGIPAYLYTGTGDLAFFLLFGVFVNLTSVFTARREDLTLKRLRSSALSDREIFCGSILGAAVVYVLQISLVLVALVTALDAGAPADPLLLLTGLLLGVAVFALLAVALSGVTPSSELSQYTVLPVLAVCAAGSGFMVPLDGLPGWAERAAAALPLSPIVEIARTAYLGRDFTVGGDHAQVGLLGGWAACGPALLVLLAWLAVGGLLAHRAFRWEPRRS